MDVRRTKICLDTSILIATNMNLMEYFKVSIFFVKNAQMYILC
jgi:hypothetical protein